MGDNISAVITVMQLIISFGTICTLLYTFSKFVSKPTDTLKDRIDSLERWRNVVEQRLSKGSAHFDTLDDSARITQQSLLAIMDGLYPLIDGDNKEELKKARNNLYEYLSDR